MSRIEASSLRTYVIVDPERTGDHSLEELARAVLDAGVRAIQLRHKGVDDDLFRREAELLCELAHDSDALFIVNDRVDIALEVGADGVHLGPDDTPVAEVRRLAPDLVIGGSAGDPKRARRLEEEGADYLGCGAIWEASPSKSDASPPRGLEMISAVSSAVSIPIVGIGGVTIERAPSVRAAGAAGVAVIRAVAEADEPFLAARKLLDVTGPSPAH